MLHYFQTNNIPLPEGLSDKQIRIIDNAANFDEATAILRRIEEKSQLKMKDRALQPDIRQDPGLVQHAVDAPPRTDAEIRAERKKAENIKRTEPARRAKQQEKHLKYLALQELQGEEARRRQGGLAPMDPREREAAHLKILEVLRKHALLERFPTIAEGRKSSIFPFGISGEMGEFGEVMEGLHDPAPGGVETLRERREIAEQQRMAENAIYGGHLGDFKNRDEFLIYQAEKDLAEARRRARDFEKGQLHHVDTSRVYARTREIIAKKQALIKMELAKGPAYELARLTNRYNEDSKRVIRQMNEKHIGSKGKALRFTPSGIKI
jgi:hypothetical protein